MPPTCLLACSRSRIPAALPLFFFTLELRDLTSGLASVSMCSVSSSDESKLCEGGRRIPLRKIFNRKVFRALQPPLVEHDQLLYCRSEKSSCLVKLYFQGWLTQLKTQIDKISVPRQSRYVSVFYAKTPIHYKITRACIMYAMTN